VEITGTMKQAGSIVLGDRGDGTTAPWSFSLDTTTGEHEAIAFDAARFAITRNVTVDAAMQLPDVDLDAGSTPFTAVGFVLHGLDGADKLSSDITFYTDHEYVDLPRSGGGANAFPSSAFTGGELEFAEAHATHGNKVRTLESFTDDGQLVTEATLLPELEVTLADGAAHWTTLPTGYDESVLSVEGDSAGVFISASPVYLADQTALAFDPSAIPDWDPAWTVVTPTSTDFYVAQFPSSGADVLSEVTDAAAASRIRSRAHAHPGRRDRRSARRPTRR
jgi:hypothetical protein